MYKVEWREKESCEENKAKLTCCSFHYNIRILILNPIIRWDCTRLKCAYLLEISIGKIEIMHKVEYNLIIVLTVSIKRLYYGKYRLHCNFLREIHHRSGFPLPSFGFREAPCIYDKDKISSNYGEIQSRVNLFRS